VVEAGPLLRLPDVVGKDVGAAGFFRFKVDLYRKPPMPFNNEGFEFQVLQVLARNRVSGGDNHISLSSAPVTDETDERSIGKKRLDASLELPVGNARFWVAGYSPQATGY
jgi:hypothetical protein